ncbi:MAG: response regulator [Chloroflexota bacterium]
MSHYDVLIVDDEVGLLLLLHRILTERTPHFVRTTASAEEAVNILATHDCDLLIADLKMPYLDGLDLLEKAKQLDKGTEVIIMTAFGSTEAAVEAITRGAYDYITKPFRKEQIIVTVERALQWRRLKAQVAALEAAIFEPPFEAALKAYREAYVRRALRRSAGDLQQAITATGIDGETLSAYQTK